MLSSKLPFRGIQLLKFKNQAHNLSRAKQRKHPNTEQKNQYNEKQYITMHYKTKHTKHHYTIQTRQSNKIQNNTTKSKTKQLLFIITQSVVLYYKFL